MREVRLKHVADVRISNVDKKSADGQVSVRLCNYTDVYYNERITSNLDFMTATATSDQCAAFRLHEGDVVLTKDSETPDDIGVSAVVTEEIPDLVCGYHLALVRPHPDRALGKYLRYALATELSRQHMSAAATGVTRFGLRSDEISNLCVPTPSMSVQRAVVDYLDSETDRIDRLISMTREMIAFLDDRDQIAFDRAVAVHGFEFPRSLDSNREAFTVPTDWAVIRLSLVLAQLTNGYVGPTRDILVDEGIPYIQSVHIKDGGIHFARRPFYVEKAWHDERPRIHLREEDVLIVQTGDIGQVAVVPPGYGAASCHALQIARVNRGLVTGRYLGTYLRSPFGYHSLLSRATGALHPHLEAGIKDIPVVVPPLSIQEQVVEEVDREVRQTAKLRSALERRIHLLQDRRRSLVSQAVAGEIRFLQPA
jgi:type I restriction enzyme, S subunit